MLQFYLTLAPSSRLSLCLLLFLILRPSFADKYWYATCRPTTCGQGPNISYPFYIVGQQHPNCGYPGPFNLTCTIDGFPLLTLPENNYLIQDISYGTESLRVHLADVSTSNLITDTCPNIRNTSLPTETLTYDDTVTRLYLFSNCSDTTKNLQSCVGKDTKWVVVHEDDHLELGKALKSCGRSVVAPVEGHGYNKSIGWAGLAAVLRRGFVLNWTAFPCGACEGSGGRCGFNYSLYKFRCFCPDRIHAWTCPIPRISYVATKGRRLKPSIAAGLGSGTIAVITCILILLILIKRYKMEKKKKKNSMNHEEIEFFIKSHGNLAPRIYKYSELKRMTNSFAECLGKGGYGTVYKGMSQDGNHPLAVKVLHESQSVSKDFMNEIASISRTSHVNIVTLLGYCFEGSKRALLYEFMPNGSLDKFIYKNELSSAILGWEKLFEIALGIARGLEYLHRGCNMRILHLDIKPQNILLDRDFNPKISDFGLAKLCQDRASIVSMSGARGTIGYTAPEVFCRYFGEVSHKSDVYSYGMMILDIVGGRKKACPRIEDHTSETYFPHWIYKQLEESNNDDGGDDGEVGEEWQMMKRKLTIIALWCIQTDSRDRPVMSRVVEMLEGNHESLKIPPDPYLCSPPRPLPDLLASTSASTSLT